MNPPAATATAEAPVPDATAPRESAREVTSFRQLARMSVAELEAVYRDGTVPAIDVLDGAPRGRMLTIRGPLGWWGPRRVLGAVARSRLFPWRGKSFHASDAEHGGGINRTTLLGERFPFETRIEPSAIDGAPCIRLDYGDPRNPFFIRAIRDELREVGPGLHLGPAMIDGANPELVLWFGIDTRR